MFKKTFLIICLPLILLITYSCERDLFTGIVEVETHVYTKIYVDTYPNSIKIFVDGRNMGLLTPDTVKWLDEGPHKVTLKSEYFNDFDLDVTTKADSIKKINIDYRSDPINYGRLECRTEPTGSNVYLNKKLQTLSTNCVINDLFAGEYSVKFVKDGFREDSLDVIIYGNRITRIHRTLDDTSKWVGYKKSNSPILSDVLSSVVVDINNKKWIGSDKGLFSFSGKTWQAFTASNSGLISDVITSIAVDKYNNLWIGTNIGILKYEGNAFINYTSELPSKYVYSILSENNNIWIGTEKGIAFFNGASWQKIPLPLPYMPGELVNTVTSLASDNNGTIWIGTLGSGVFSYKNGLWKQYKTGNMSLTSYVGDTVGDLVLDGNGNLWVGYIANSHVGTVGGICKFNGQTWEYFSLDGILNNSVRKLYADPKNNIWVCTNDGIGKFSNNPLSMKTYTTFNSLLPSSSVAAVCIDSNDDLWIATVLSGLIKAKNGNY